MSSRRKMNSVIAELEKKANNGDINAQVILAADFYSRGNKFQGVGKDITKAIKYYTNAAKHNHRGAQYDLAEMYLKGDNIPKDINKALELFKQSAEGLKEIDNTSSKLAITKLAHLYSHDFEQITDIPKDINLAISYYKLLSEVEDNNAQSALIRLGYFYKNGDDVEQDLDKAITYFQKSLDKADELNAKNIWVSDTAVGRALLELEVLGKIQINRNESNKNFFSKFSPSEPAILKSNNTKEDIVKVSMIAHEIGKTIEENGTFSYYSIKMNNKNFLLFLPDTDIIKNDFKNIDIKTLNEIIIGARTWACHLYQTYPSGKDIFYMEDISKINYISEPRIFYPAIIFQIADKFPNASRIVGSIKLGLKKNCDINLIHINANDLFDYITTGKSRISWTS